MEVWKTIEGFGGQYSVSDLGRIRSNYRWHINPKTKERYLKERQLIMTPNLSTGGYFRIKLSDKRIHPLHRLVAKCFCENPQDKLYVNHRDGDKTNNHPVNLEWVTVQENNQHAWDTGLNHSTGSVEKLAKNWTFVSPSQEVVEIYNLSNFCRENSLTKTLMLRVNTGSQKHHKGWTKYVSSK
ncbi:MAG: NUMOD4 domain-containing protein [Bacteroidales bacterium]